MVEGDASYEVTIQGVIFTLMQMIRLVMGIKCGGGWFILQEASSHHPCSSCHTLSSPRVGGTLGACLPFINLDCEDCSFVETPRSPDPTQYPPKTLPLGVTLRVRF